MFKIKFSRQLFQIAYSIYLLWPNYLISINYIFAPLKVS